MISAYEQFCEAYECWTTRQLEDFVKALTRPYSIRSLPSLAVSTTVRGSRWKSGTVAPL